MAENDPILTPRLVVDGAARAIELYERVFGAECLECYVMKDGRIVHAVLSIGGAVVALADEDAPRNRGPKQFGGSPVILHLMVEDPDAVAESLVAMGGEILIPVGDQFYGYREGRVADPFGHVWILSRRLEILDPKEIQKRVSEWEG